VEALPNGIIFPAFQGFLKKTVLFDARTFAGVGLVPGVQF
jgi:hypothetical protein